MKRQEDSHERPIIARRFYEQNQSGDERRPVLCVCGRPAVVWDRRLDQFYCSRCWEFVEA